MGKISLKSNEYTYSFQKYTIDELFNSIKDKDVMFGGPLNLATDDLQYVVSKFDSSYMHIMSLYFYHHIDYCMKLLLDDISNIAVLVEKGFTRSEITHAHNRIILIASTDAEVEDDIFLKLSLNEEDKIQKATEDIRKGIKPNCDIKTYIAAQKQFNAEMKMRLNAFSSTDGYSTKGGAV